MNSEITFSLLNFSTSAENGSLRAKPSASKFSKLSSSKKLRSNSKKENVETKENSCPSKNIAKNLLSSYSDKVKDSTINSILKERNNTIDNTSNACKVKNSFKNASSPGIANKKVENGVSAAAKDKSVLQDPNVLGFSKFNTYQEIIDHSKKTFLKTNTNGSRSVGNKENLLFQKKQIEADTNSNHEGTISVLKKSNECSIGQALKVTSPCLGTGSDKHQAHLIKSNSLSTSFSSLDNSAPKIVKKGSKLAPVKLSESIISISSSPESNEKSLYESLTSFFPEKFSKASKKLISSTPRCSEVFYSPPNISYDFESTNFSLSKINSHVSKSSSITSLTKDSIKVNPQGNDEYVSNKTSAISIESNRKISISSETNSGTKKCNNLSNVTFDKYKSSSNFENVVSETAHDSSDRKIKAKVNSSDKTSDSSKSIEDRFDAVKNSSNKLSCNMTNSYALTEASLSSSNKSDVVPKNSRNKKSNSTKKNSSEDAFEKLRGSLTTNSHLQTSKEDNASQRFKSSDESRIISDTLRFRGITVRRHRRQKVLGLQKDFMYEETSDSSEEECNDENKNSDSGQKVCKDVSIRKSLNNCKSSLNSEDSLSPVLRKFKRKPLLESSKSFSDNSSRSLYNGSKSNELPKKLSGSSISENLRSSRGTYNDRTRNSQPKQSLEIHKSGRKNSSISLVNDSGACQIKRNSFDNISSSCSDVSKSDSVLEAEKLLNELYGTTWHDKKATILPRSTAKKKVSKEKPQAVNRQTLYFSSDESDCKENVSKRKILKKKKQDSFIDNDSSSSEAEDLNFYRTLSNKLPSSSAKSKFSSHAQILSSSSEDLFSSVKRQIGYKTRSNASESGSLSNLNVSLKSKNGGVNQSGKKGKVKGSPTFIARKTNVLTSTLSDSKFKKPSVKKPSKAPLSADKTFELSSDSELDSDSNERSLIKHSAPGRSKKSVKPIINTPLKPIPKRCKISTPRTPGREPRLSFLASLSVTADENRVHPDAVPYKKFYKSKKEELARRLLILYNKEVFESRLPDDMLLQWNARMRSTSGYCYNKKVRRTGIEMARVSRIVLSTKILDTPERLRDTLLHELCHAAAWVINGTADGHGPLWKSWANKAMRRFPEVPPVKRCHDYSIKTKFTYRCTSCGYSIGRHSKSLDITRKRCGYCYGAFELLVNHAKSNRKSAENLKAPRTPNKFALFVKEKYGEVKKENAQKSHAEIMKILGQLFNAEKNQVEKT